MHGTIKEGLVILYIETSYSAIDYPGCMSLVLFFYGCDLRCKYCHNPELLQYHQVICLDELFHMIDTNYIFFDAIVFTGGEALLHSETINQIIDYTRKYNLKYKLDTNGLHPIRLRKIIKYLDYVALDVKAPLDKYYKITNRVPLHVCSKILRSINIIKEYDVFLECRTTYTSTLLSPNDIQEILNIIECDQYTLQQYRNDVIYDISLKDASEPTPYELKLVLKKINTDNKYNIYIKTNQSGIQKI